MVRRLLLTTCRRVALSVPRPHAIAAPIEDVGESSAQPDLAVGIVVPDVDRFAGDVGVMATETCDLLLQPPGGLGHEILVAARPELIAMGKCARDAFADCFDRVFAHELGIERRQLAMPINRLLGLRFCHRHVHTSDQSR